VVAGAVEGKCPPGRNGFECRKVMRRYKQEQQQKNNGIQQPQPIHNPFQRPGLGPQSNHQANGGLTFGRFGPELFQENGPYPNANSNNNPNIVASGGLSHSRFGPELFQENGPYPNGNNANESESDDESSNSAYDQLMNGREITNSFKRSGTINPKPAACGQAKTESGFCRALFKRFTYDSATNSCVAFNWGGCGGTENNFVTISQCEQCIDLPAIELKTAIKKAGGRANGFNRNAWGNFGFLSDMTLPKENENGVSNPCDDPPITEPGFCRALITTFTYLKDSNECVPAAFGGCAMGTTNSFQTMEACQQECSNKEKEDQGYTLDEMMSMSGIINAQTLSYDEITQPECSKENPCGCRKDVGLPMGKKTKMWYYDSLTGQCDTLFYRGFMGNANRFEDECECLDRCGNPEQKCGAEVEPAASGQDPICLDRMAQPGFCRALIQVYSYNQETGTCEMKINGGCDIGTDNFFATKEACESKCVVAEVGLESRSADSSNESGGSLEARCLKSFDEPDLTNYYGETYGYLVYDQEKGKCRKAFFKNQVVVWDVRENLFPSFPKCRLACQPELDRKG